jgi:hypothetical protein
MTYFRSGSYGLPIISGLGGLAAVASHFLEPSVGYLVIGILGLLFAIRSISRLSFPYLELGPAEVVVRPEMRRQVRVSLQSVSSWKSTEYPDVLELHEISGATRTIAIGELSQADRTRFLSDLESIIPGEQFGS